MDSNALEACQRFERTTKSRKITVRFPNRKYCKKALFKRKKLANLDNEKYQLGSRIFISENLPKIYENITLTARKLKRRGTIHGCFRRNDVVHIKLGKDDKGIKILRKSNFCEHILDYEEEEEDLFHDVSQEVSNSVQSS